MNNPSHLLLRRLRLRWFFATMVSALIAALVLRSWLVQGIFKPVRVTSGSMADTLYGPHWRTPCRQCLFPIVCGKDSPPDRSLAVCPNCGFAGNKILPNNLLPGMRVLIDKATLGLRSPRRWETVIIRNPLDPRRLVVKRVVGLPTERVSLQHGDVYIQEKISRKTLSHLRSFSLLVHDDRFRPPDSLGLPSRWQGREPATRWKTIPAGYVWTPEKSAKPTSEEIDWLSYRHWLCMASPVERTQEAEVMDQYGYNQGLSRQLNKVTDLLLVFRVKMSGPGKLVLMARDGFDSFQAILFPQNNSIELLKNDQVLTATHFLFPRKEIKIEYSLCDRQVLLALDGQLVTSQLYESSRVPLRENLRPLAIGVTELKTEIRDIQIFRDIYYLAPSGNNQPWTTDSPLKEDEYFLLGDNCPASQDSRHWPNGGGIPRKFLVGKPMATSKTGYQQN